MNSSQKYTIGIIGGGLAGLCCAIDLSRKGISVCLIEKEVYPKHKVCGEYISNEVKPYLESLGFHISELGATSINRFELSTSNGNLIKSKLPLGGFGLSRYTMDYNLAKIAIDNGVTILNDTVEQIDFVNNQFTLQLKSNKRISCDLSIGAYGKRSNLDLKSKRSFVQNKSPFLAVKFHANGTFDNDLVALHNFDGGYCGVSKVENEIINICYITTYESFKRYKDIESFQQYVVMKNPHLNKIFKNSTPKSGFPLTISQISFASKTKIENHVLMCGDSAGMIHPLCGNGMGMAIRSAYILSKIIDRHLNTAYYHDKIEKEYLSSWNSEFKLRLTAGRAVASLFTKPKITSMVMNSARHFPFILPSIIRLTHGKVMDI